MKIKTLFIFCFFAGSLLAQQLQWFKEWKGPTANVNGSKVKTDASGNVYASGAFSSTIDVDPGPGVQLATASGFGDAYLEKFGSNGQLKFIKVFSTSSTDVVSSVCIGPGGSVFVAWFSGTAFYLDKLDANGNTLIHKIIGGSNDQVQDMIFDNNYNLIVTGRFSGTRDFDPGPGISNLTTSGSYDVFFAKYDTTYALAWAKNVGSASIDMGSIVRMDINNNILVAGTYESTWMYSNDFDPGPGVKELSHEGLYNIFVGCYDGSGNLVWAKSLGGSGNELVNDIKIDPVGNIFLCGNFSSDINCDPDSTGPLMLNGYNEGFVAIYNDTLHCRHAFKLGGQNGFDATSGLILQPDETFLVGINFQDTIDIDPDTSAITLLNTQDGRPDIAIIAYDTACHLLQVLQIGTPPGREQGNAISQATDGFYMTGYFNSVCDFNPGFYPEVKTAQGTYTAYLGKYLFKSNTLGGHIFLDSNGDTLHQQGEQYLPNYWINLFPGNYQRTSDNAGFFRFATDTGTKILSASSYNHWIAVPVSQNAGFNTFWNTDTSLVFAVQAADTFLDLETIITPYFNVARPGFQTGYHITLINNGTTNFSGISLALIKDQWLNYQSSIPLADTMNADTIVWNNLSVPVFGLLDFDAFFQVSTSAPNNGTLQLISIPINAGIDSVPQNTSDTLLQPIRGSHDPNIKVSYPEDTLSISDQDIVYTIHFQNTGTDTAFTVVIRDTLNMLLDASTLQLLTSSDPVQMTAFGDGRLSFVFYNILLPDSSTNLLGSTGFVTFRVKIRQGLTPSDTIYNTAFIYFDYNDPIQTNITKNYLYAPNWNSTDSKPVQQGTVIIYPNPACGAISILFDAAIQEETSIVLTDVTGKQILVSKRGKNQDKLDLDVSSLPEGMYFIILNSAGYNKNSKLIIAR
jgi:hypothetical protein